MVVIDNTPQSINAVIIDMQRQIDQLKKQVKELESKVKELEDK